MALSSWSQVAHLLPGDGPDEHGARFGSSAVSHGETLAIGAPRDFRTGGGAVYVFVRSGAAFTLQARLAVPVSGGGGPSDAYALALSQDSLVVGSHVANNYKGAAYVYVRQAGNWTLQAELSQPDPGNHDGFGMGVAIDNDTAVVGAYHAAGVIPNTGAAYVFVRSGSSWTLEAKLQASDGRDEDYFGTTVALLGDAAFVGVPAGMTTRIGAVHVYERVGASWTEQARLSTSDVANWDEFARTLAVSGDTLAAAAPYRAPGGAVYVFTRDGSSWSAPQKLTTSTDCPLGYSLALSENTLVAGAPGWGTCPRPGASAHVFGRNGGSWKAAGRLAASDGLPGDEVGSGVAIMGDRIVVGAGGDDTSLGIDSGSAYVFGPFAKGDLDGDLRTDLVLRHAPTGDNVAWRMDGTTRLGEAVPILPTPAALTQRPVAVDDFDRDGRNDLAIWDSASGALEFWLMEGTTRLGVVPLEGAPPAAWEPVATGDFNGDMMPDIVWRQAPSGTLAVWTLNGVARLGDIVPSPNHGSYAHWEIMAAFDCDGDDVTDLLWRNPDSGRVVQWLMDDSVQRIAGRFIGPPAPANANWRAVSGARFASGPGGATDMPAVVWRNLSSGRYVIWSLDFSGNRTAGAFTSPAAPESDPSDWTVVGPR